MATTGFGRAICRRKRREIRGLSRATCSLCGAEYALSIVCAASDGDRVDAVLAADPAQARTLDAGWCSPLSYAAGNGHTQIVEKLLDLGADPVALAESPWAQPLYWAEKEGHGEVAALLKEWSDGEGTAIRK